MIPTDPVRTPLFLAALLCLPPAFSLGFDDPKKPQDSPLRLGGAPAGAEDPHAEMKRLFGKIERDLREIDRLLSDASAGGASAAEAGRKSAEAIAGIDELLKKSQTQSRTVVTSIDRILELADHPHEPGGT